MRKNLRAALGVKILLVVALGVFFFTGVYAKPAWSQSKKSKPMTLKAISFLPSNDEAVYYMGVFADRVTKRSKGELIVNWIGGPEAIPMYDQPSAVQKGVVDISLGPTVFYLDRIPEGDSLHLSEYTAVEERERGFYEYMAKLHKEKMNVYYLGRVETNVPFYLFTSKRSIGGQKDLTGLKISVPELGISVAKAWGAVPVSIPLPDNYTAMERGTVDATFMAITTFVAFGVQGATKYMVDHPLYENDLVLLANLDTWNRIPKHLQDLMKEVTIEIEKEMAEFFDKASAGARKKIMDAQVKTVKLSPEDAKWYRDLAYEAGWKDFEKSVGVETASKIQGMLKK